MLKNKKISDLKTNNLTGLKIGKLTVIGISEFRNKHNRIKMMYLIYWLMSFMSNWKRKVAVAANVLRI